jgi:hypothetical protein
VDSPPPPIPANALAAIIVFIVGATAQQMLPTARLSNQLSTKLYAGGLTEDEQSNQDRGLSANDIA